MSCRRARLAACCRAVSEDWLDCTVKRVGLVGPWAEIALLLAVRTYTPQVPVHVHERHITCDTGWAAGSWLMAAGCLAHLPLGARSQPIARAWAHTPHAAAKKRPVPHTRSHARTGGAVGVGPRGHCERDPAHPDATIRELGAIDSRAPDISLGEREAYVR